MLYCDGYMQLAKHDNSLEKYKIFPYVAWILVFVGVFALYNLTAKLTEVTQNLERQTQILQQQVNQPIQEITNFSE